MTEKLDRKELRRPDTFMQTVRRAFTWGISHLPTIILTVGSLCLLGATIYGYRFWSDRQGEKVASLYYDLASEIEAIETLEKEKAAALSKDKGADEAGKIKEKEAQIQVREKNLQQLASRIESDYGSTPSGGYALLEYASHLKRKEGGGLELFTKLAKKSGLVGDTASLNAGYLHEEKGDCRQAISFYEGAKESRYPFLEVDSLWGKARCLEAMGQGKEAVALYDQIIALYPATFYGEKSKILKGVMAGK